MSSKILLCFFLLQFTAFHIFAQGTGPSVSGIIADQTGAIVAGATVTLVDQASGRTRTTQTSSNGSYTFENVSPGKYRLSVSAPSFNEFVREMVVSGNNISVNIQLSVRGVSAVVNVEAEAARVELDRVPGGTELLSRSEIQQTPANNLKDVLNFAPGVLAQSRYGSDEAQFSVRGSGLRNNYHARGINIMINGQPYGDADGFSDYESLEFLAAQRIELWKGANALRFGGNSAGGALNLVTGTGETAVPLELRIQAGGYGNYKGYISTGGQKGRFGYFISGSASEFEGYREHSYQGRRKVFGNATYDHSENTEFYADVVLAKIAEKLPGALTFAEFRANPRQANPEDVLNDWGRYANYFRLSAGGKHRFGNGHEISINLSGQYRDLIHPIFQVLDQDTQTFSAEVRYSYTRANNRFVAGFAPQVTLRGERRFENLMGTTGPRANHFDARANNYGFYFENQHDFASKFTLVTGGRVDYAYRRLTDRFLSNGDQSDERKYKVFSPKIGFVYRARETAQIFANLSRSYEPPIIGELASYGAPGFLPLEAQDTWQFELGTRGDLLGKRWNYEISFFNSAISNEVINSNVQSFPNAPFTIPSFRSAPKTRHTGLELSTNAVLGKDLFVEGGDLGWRTAYTLSDFQFTEDPNFDGNFIPGAPRHLLRSELRYNHPKGFWISPNVDWSPTSYFVNSANTARNDSYAVFNVRAGFDRRKYGIFFEANNLADRIYSASVIVDDAMSRFYEPAIGRSAQAGIYFRFGGK